MTDLSPDYSFCNRVVDGLLGLAVGDAFGVPVEFMSRKEVREIDLQDMVGNDTAPGFWSTWSDEIPHGAWSDDTSMTVAAMSSIINHQGQIDYDDIMSQFLAWWNEGKYTSLDYPFGLGNTVYQALMRYRNGTQALEYGGKGFKDNGNGALMRIFPFSIYCIRNNYNDEELHQLIRNAAGLTHGHSITAMSCYLYSLFLRECIRTKDPMSAYGSVFIPKRIIQCRYMFSEEAIVAHERLFSKDLCYRDFDQSIIPESGYVVDSLTIAVYSILHTNNYEDAVKMAVNFGYDTDTNAAITGSIAGAMYGKEQIPARWMNALRKKDYLILIGEQFAECIGNKIYYTADKKANAE